MITEILIPQLKTRFAGRPLVLGTGSEPAATFPAAHPDVGDLVIRDDGDELTIYLGTVTHAHLGEYEEGLTESERAERIARDALAFLEDIFADRIEFFCSRLGAGGYRKRDGKPRGRLTKRFFGIRTYVWSGPVDE